MSRRHALVTGAAGGIGAACAEACAREGMAVTGVDARGEVLDEQMERLGKRYAVPVQALETDLTDSRLR